MPRYRFELTGIPLYDPRKDSTAGGDGPQRLADRATWAPTENPIVIAWNLMRGIPLPGREIYGGGITDLRRLPREVWALAMNRCDAPAGRADGTTEPMYRAGLEIALDQPPAAALEEIFKAASATVADLGYGWGVVAGAPALPVYAFTDDDVIVSRQQELDPFPGLQDTWNAVSAKYPDPAHFWETKDAPQRTNAAWEASDAFGRRMANLSLPAVPYPGQVQRLMRAWIEDERRFRRQVIALPPDSAHVELIDTMDWSSLRNGYGGKDWSVHEILEDPRTGIRQFSIRERDPLDYSWRPDFELPSAPAPAAPAPVIPEPVSGYAATAVILRDQGGIARRAGIRQVWDADIVALGFAWEIRLSGTTEVILRGSSQDIETGTHITTAGILPNTSYEIRARLIKVRETAWTTWRTVVTQMVAGETVDIPAEVLDRIAVLETWVDGTGADIDATLAGIETDIARIDGLVGGVRTDLTAEAAALRTEAMDNLAVAKAYSDTGLLSESFERQGVTDELAARIDQLTAALVSEQLLQNGSFADGLTWWTRSGTGTILTRDPADPDALVQTMPAGTAATIDAGGAVAQMMDIFEVGAQDRLQFRFSAGALGSTARQLELQVRWFDLPGAEITPAVTYPLTLAAGGVWRVQSGRIDPPDTARSAEVKLAHVSASGERVQITKFEATIVNGAVEARVAELEAAQATTTGAIATQKSETEARFGVNEARLADEENARATADAAAVLRLNALETSNGSNTAKVETLEAAVVDLDRSAATLEQSVSAAFGATEKVRDGVFARGLTHWPSGTLGTDADVLTKSKTGDWRTMGVPADRYFRIPSGTSLSALRRSAPMPAAPGDVIDMSMAYARAGLSVQPRMRAVFRNAQGTALAPSFPAVITGTGSEAWMSAFLGGIVAPAGTVDVVFEILSAVDGSVDAWVTQLSGRKRGAFEHQSAADVADLKYAMSDPNGAVAGIRTTVEANFVNLDGRVKSQATAIADRYTKAQTDTAISTGISNFNATLTDRFNAKASASTVSALISQVNNVEGELVAQSDAITRTEARTNRASANGLFRMTSVASGAGASTRIALIAEAAANQVAQRAGLFIEAGNDGDNNVFVLANTFAVINARDANAPRTVPFVVRDGQVRITNAFVDTLAIQGNAIIVPVMAEAESALSLGGDGQWFNALSLWIGRAGAPTALLGTFQIDGFGSAAVQFRLLRNNVVISGPWVNVTGSRGSQAATGINFLDRDLGSGATHYLIQAARMNTGDYQSGARVLKRNLLGLHLKR